MTPLAVAVLLTQAGAAEWHLPADVDDLALHLVDACGDGPRRAPQGLTCARALVAIWHTETAGTFAVHPKPRGTGCGALQVVTMSPFGNTALGRWSTPPCGVLTWHLPTALHWGLLVLRAKSARLRSWHSRFRAYNASARAALYAVRAMRTFKRLGGIR